MPAKRATKILITSINRYGKNKKKEQDDYKQVANCIKDENSGYVTIPVNIYMQITSTDGTIRCCKQPFRSNIKKRIHNNFEIIKRMLIEEKKNILYVAKWIRIPYLRFCSILQDYMKWIVDKKDKLNERLREESNRMDNLKFLIQMGIAAYKGRWINTKIILDFVQKTNNDEGWKPYKYSEVRRWMINYMNYSWRKANVRPPRSLRAGLEEDRIAFIKFVNNLKTAKFVIVYIDEWSFNSSTLPLYTWMKKGEDASIVIRDSNTRFNSIAAQWESNLYFMIKDETSKEDDICQFLILLKRQLELTIQKDQLKNRTVLIMDNARIHRTNKVTKLIKDLKLIVFTIPPYSPELNKIENTFGIIKNKLSFKNLNIKQLKQLAIEEIKNMKKL